MAVSYTLYHMNGFSGNLLRGDAPARMNIFLAFNTPPQYKLGNNVKYKLFNIVLSMAR
jgi:hypothetical protein